MIIVNYHQVSIAGASSLYDISTSLFQAQIDALIEHGFSFATLQELLRTAPEQERPRECAITFDDGRLGAYEHGARILRERGIRATYFVCPDWMESKPTAATECYSDFMTWDHAAELTREGNIIGSHGKSHLPLFDIEAGAAHREVSESKILIERRLGVACDHFASPWGQIDGSVMRLVRECGYGTLSSTAPGPNKVPYERYRLRRLDSACYASLAAFKDAIRRHTDAHARLDVVLLTLPGRRPDRVSCVEAIARFDLAICLDDPSHELCLELGLRCLRHRPAAGDGVGSLRERLLATHGDLARDRELSFAPLILR
jgi:peptidoglycan/xylan/chitin deacetylase (PgdA/CDA1 family)